MKARAYMEAPPMSVVLCANRLQDQAEMEEALVHELVHVYDVSMSLYVHTNCCDYTILQHVTEQYTDRPSYLLSDHLSLSLSRTQNPSLSFHSTPYPKWISRVVNN